MCAAAPAPPTAPYIEDTPIPSADFLLMEVEEEEEGRCPLVVVVEITNRRHTSDGRCVRTEGSTRGQEVLSILLYYLPIFMTHIQKRWTFWEAR
jgi:hypothetical protein